MKRTGVLALLLLLASSASAFTFRSRPSPLLRRSTPPLRAEAAEWQDCAGGGGCKVLRPPVGTEPRALVHFLGGAFVSPQPTVAYRHVLESLADRGYVVCATPFAVDFDYRLPCGAIRDDFDVALLFAHRRARAEDGLIHELAVDGVVPPRRRVVDGDRREREAEDAVKLGGDEESAVRKIKVALSGQNRPERGAGGNNEKETPSESNFRDSRASSDFNFVVSRDRQSNIMPAKMLSKEKKRGK